LYAPMNSFVFPALSGFRYSNELLERTTFFKQDVQD
jgi:hypothetical protein